MIKIEKEHSYGILAIVAIVAIVALFNLSSQTKVVTTTESSIEESEDLVGKATLRYGGSNSAFPSGSSGGGSSSSGNGGNSGSVDCSDICEVVDFNPGSGTCQLVCDANDQSCSEICNCHPDNGVVICDLFEEEIETEPEVEEGCYDSDANYGGYGWNPDQYGSIFIDGVQMAKDSCNNFPAICIESLLNNNQDYQQDGTMDQCRWLGPNSNQLIEWRCSTDQWDNVDCESYDQETCESYDNSGCFWDDGSDSCKIGYDDPWSTFQSEDYYPYFFSCPNGCEDGKCIDIYEDDNVDPHEGCIWVSNTKTVQLGVTTYVTVRSPICDMGNQVVVNDFCYTSASYHFNVVSSGFGDWDTIEEDTFYEEADSEDTADCENDCQCIDGGLSCDDESCLNNCNCNYWSIESEDGNSGGGGVELLCASGGNGVGGGGISSFYIDTYNKWSCGFKRDYDDTNWYDPESDDMGKFTAGALCCPR